MNLPSMRRTPTRPIALAAIGVLIGSLLSIAALPGLRAEGAAQSALDAASDTALAAGYDPTTDPVLQDKGCPRDDPCMRTAANWGSPRRMQDRFNAGVLKNADEVLLPARIRRMATKRWNEDHGVVALATDTDPKRGVWDCGGHWWCKPLDVGSGVVSTFLCAAQNLGWDETKSITLKCGGLSIIGGRFGLEAGGPPGAFWVQLVLRPHASMNRLASLGAGGASRESP